MLVFESILFVQPPPDPIAQPGGMASLVSVLRDLLS